MQCEPFICADPASVRLSTLARRAAMSRSGMIIHGDAGTGRLALARYIHDNSARAAAAFIVFDCIVVPEAAHMSELFGDADDDGGVLARASGGTVVLHNVCGLSRPAQDRLVRLMHDSADPCRARLIGTMRGAECGPASEGRLGAELAGLLGVLALRVAPLRERPGDIAPLAQHFLSRFAAEIGLRAPALSASAAAMLADHAWPGNVRELRNVMQRTLIFAEGDVLSAGDLMFDPAVTLRNAAGPGDLVGRTVAEVERELILDTLRHCEGNRTRASEILGISVRTLRNKIRQYSDDGLDVPAYSRAA